MANSSVSSFLTDTKQTCKNSNPPWVQDVKILRCWDPQTLRYLDARMPRYVFQTWMWCFHENSNRNSIMERWIHMCSVLWHKTNIYNVYLLIFLSKHCRKKMIWNWILNFLNVHVSVSCNLRSTESPVCLFAILLFCLSLSLSPLDQQSVEDKRMIPDHLSGWGGLRWGIWQMVHGISHSAVWWQVGESIKYS